MKLFEPYKVGNVQLKNRIIMAPMVMGLVENGEVMPKQLVDYYARRAEGGVGLIIVEGTAVEPVYAGEGGLMLDDDKYISAVSKLTKAVKGSDVKMIIQLAHPGKQVSSRLFGIQTVAPSPLPDPVFKEKPRPLTIDEIKELVRRFVQSAVRAKNAGFDGVEIHGAHGYLISQFLSPFDNERTDEYGDDTAGRAKFATDIVKGIREELDNFLIFFRISAEQFTNGLHLEESKAIVPLLEDAGADVIHVSAGRYATIQWLIPPMTQPRGCLVPLAAEIHRVARKPVVAVGRINTLELAEQILQQGSADLIAVGRPLLADPDFPKKVMVGKGDQIRPCIACNTCFDTRLLGEAVSCAVNPEVKLGKKAKLNSTQQQKTVVVVGGGPGGMESAWSLAMRGHRVTLFEKGDQLGGQLLLAAVVPGRQEFMSLVDFYRREFQRLSITVKYGVEATVESVQREEPDAVFIATGATPAYPEIPGIDSYNVVTAHDILAGKVDAGKKVVIIGGALTGCETARFLAEEGRNVTVLRRGKRMAIEAGWSKRRLLLEELRSRAVTLLTEVEYKGINKDGVLISKDSKEMVLPADTIVLATGVKQNDNLAEQLRGKVRDIFVIGDCKEPRKMIDAIEEGRVAALQV